MAAVGGEQEREPARFVYVPSFGSHQYPHLTTERLDGAHPELKDCMSTLSLTQKTLAKKFDFPIPLNEASKIMKKKKKVSVWDRVYKLISRMLEENEKYRLRLKCQRLPSENSN